ncbi:hypothetical protein CLV46_2440 [Diaminobutyricimonas aerilata]|uniref:Peptide subunit release factor 1 (ERF1) n=1 Tax=Diaminobutyricimonas aerilata TaxID=1162967 RepID=A0A2M9CLT8_9MICO|nr:hypothetical protein [Diaminobutyricimonas aerilata]PJJ72863.1 hypothetical protein CLV46_2440 [Diaminobutyricimonas aerilata]
MQNVDIPTIEQVQELSAERGPCISLYVDIEPGALQAQNARVALKSLANDADRELTERGVPEDQVKATCAHIRNIIDDEEFWRFQARSVAVFASPTTVRSYRMANRVHTEVTASDRFRLGQLLHALAFPYGAWVLVLSEKNARLVGVAADAGAHTVDVDGLPPDTSVLERTAIADRAAMPRPQGATGDRIEQQKYARLAQEAILPIVKASGLPLILAAAQPLVPAYQAINEYPHFVEEIIDGNHDNTSDDELGRRAVPILDALYARQLESWREEFQQLENEGRAVTDVSETARAATFGAVDSLMIDLDSELYGRLADDDGAVQFGDEAHRGDYAILDEIAARVLQASGRVLPVHAGDLPNGSPVAAILRYGV